MQGTYKKEVKKRRKIREEEEEMVASSRKRKKILSSRNADPLLLWSGELFLLPFMPQNNPLFPVLKKKNLPLLHCHVRRKRSLLVDPFRALIKLGIKKISSCV